jgi:DNA polymerase III subunit delta
MKVYPEKLGSRLKQGTDRLFIVSGDEPLLIQESCDLIRAELRRAGFSERQVFHVVKGFDWQQVLFNANSMSLFAEQKLLEIRCSTKPDKEAMEVLKALAGDMPQDTAMLLILPKIDKKVESAAWFKALDQAGVHVAIWPVTVEQLPKWIAARFQAAGLRPSADAVTAMVDLVEGNLLAAMQEIERLKLVVEGDTVDVGQVLDGVGDSARYNVFSLIDAAVGQDPVRTLKVIQGLRVEGAEIFFIVLMLGRELRTLVNIATALEQGEKLDAAMQKYYVFANRRSLVGACLRARSRLQLESVQQQVSQLDKLFKGIGTGNPWDLLTTLLLRLAGKPVIANRAA